MIELLELKVKGNLDVAYGADIIGQLTWKNVAIPVGLELPLFAAVFFLGKAESLYYTTFEGVDYLLGSMVTDYVPVPGTTLTTEIPSKALFVDTWDVQAVIGVEAAPIMTLTIEGRIVGLSLADIEAGRLQYYEAKWFTGVLNVAAPPKAVEISTFSFVAG